jgi:hypothetical protein
MGGTGGTFCFGNGFFDLAPFGFVAHPLLHVHGDLRSQTISQAGRMGQMSAGSGLGIQQKDGRIRFSENDHIACNRIHRPANPNPNQSFTQ